MTAKLGDPTNGTNRSRYPSFENTSRSNEPKMNKPWSAVLHDIFVSLADDSTFLEQQNEVIVSYKYFFFTIKFINLKENEL